MSEHCRHHVLEHVFNLPQPKREEYISNKSTVVTSLLLEGWGKNNLSVYNWAYCVACNKGKFKNCNSQDLGIERWVKKHTQCDCRWPEVQHLFKNPKKPIKRVIKVNPLSQKTVGLSEEDKEKIEFLEQDIEDIREERNGLKEDLKKYTTHHEEDIKYSEEQMDKLDKLPKTVPDIELNYLIKLEPSQLVAKYRELYEKEHKAKIEIHNNYSKRFVWDEEDDD
jgi:hypothetical protein